MSDEGAFLQRWSRRKRAANAQRSDKSEATSAEPVAAAEQPFDVTILPPIETITELTDVTAFLQKGVPADLTRAALRRVWTADPAIRDFVGLAENAWDFTDPAAMPGFGPLEATDEVRRMIAQVVEQIGQAAQPGDSAAPEGKFQIAENSSYSNEMNGQSAVHNSATKPEEAGEKTAQNLGSEVMLQSSKEITASRHDVSEDQEKPQHFSRRTHGSALPR